MKWMMFIPASLITILLCWMLNGRVGEVPPLGKFFSPFTGFWQNNENGKMSDESLVIPGLRDEVRVVMDDNLVPHIFAKNNHDLFLAQGYIHAKYRLWQMDFQTMAAAGRISEIIGEKALDYDRQQRRFGMVYGAEKTVAVMETDPQSKEAADAYTSGVNAYINSLSERDLPVEYKLLDYKPGLWSNLKCALLLKYMSYDLSGLSSDWKVTNVLKAYGMPAIDSLFTNHPYADDPIIPKGTTWDFQPIPAPAIPGDAVAEAGNPEFDHEPNPLNGSNNWAVSGSKTASGLPILCGDPHLGLNLPSLWYQMQLVSPDYDVSGASLPGVPMIIIGFNRNIAWSETNVDADVLDWYSVQYRDASRKEYFYNHEWKKTTKKAEVIKVRGGKDVIDTVVYTHHGPVVFEKGKSMMRKDFPMGYAMRWLAHDGTMELKTFLLLNKASNYNEYVDALQYFQCPAQNFVYADAANNIAMWVNGKYPLKWKNQGKFLLDGSKPENEWQGYLPHDHDPHVINPERGFVSSNNQTPADDSYPYYLNWRFEVVTRAHRTNERLAGMSNITADSMRLLQFDNRNMIAEFDLDSMAGKTDLRRLDDFQKNIFSKLKQWDRDATASSMEQSVFNLWWKNLTNAIWADELGADSLMYPETDITMNTVHFNINKNWIDNKTTPQVETLGDLATQSFISACDTLRRYFGDNPVAWSWSDVKNTHINHLLRIAAFSRSDMKTSGNAMIVNATGYDHGPSWRMIVELGPKPHAYGIYPGGQSGNPGSPFYDNMINKWAAGEQNEVLILSSPDENNPHIVSATILKSK